MGKAHQEKWERNKRHGEKARDHRDSWRKLSQRVRSKGSNGGNGLAEK